MAVAPPAAEQSSKTGELLRILSNSPWEMVSDWWPEMMSNATAVGRPIPWH